MQVFRILIVDDDPDKAEFVECALLDLLPDTQGWDFTTVCCYNEAYSHLKDFTYDLVILDLLLPLRTGSIPNAEISKTLAREILSSSFQSSPIIFGLTAFPEKQIAQRESFSKMMLNLETFSTEDTGWSKRFARAIQYLSRHLKHGGLLHRDVYLTDIIIVCARHETEFLPICKKLGLGEATKLKHDLFPQLEARHGYVNLGGIVRKSVIVVELPAMGPSAAAGITTQLSMVFRPKLVGMIGMCCGFQDSQNIRLGDVLIADESVCWDVGKYDDTHEDLEAGFIHRPRTLTLNQDIRSIVDSFMEQGASKESKRLSRLSGFRGLQSKPDLAAEVGESVKIIRGKVATGSGVVSDAKLRDKIRTRVPDSQGLDMEIYGVYQAINSLPKQDIDYIGIKGVADFGENKTDGKYDPAQSVATIHALSVFIKIASRYFGH